MIQTVHSVIPYCVVFGFYQSFSHKQQILTLRLVTVYMTLTQGQCNYWWLCTSPAYMDDLRAVTEQALELFTLALWNCGWWREKPQPWLKARLRVHEKSRRRKSNSFPAEIERHRWVSSWDFYVQFRTEKFWILFASSPTIHNFMTSSCLRDKHFIWIWFLSVSFNHCHMDLGPKVCSYTHRWTHKLGITRYHHILTVLNGWVGGFGVFKAHSL